MSRRWKIALALAMVGIAAFLVWAFRSAATPPLTIRFAGYRTNSALRLDETLPPKDGSVLAVFAVTNHTAHTMTVGAVSIFHFVQGNSSDPGRWLNVTNYDPYLGTNFPQLEAGEGALVGARIFDIDKPIGMTVGEVTALGRLTWWKRFLLGMPWNKVRPAATATSEPR